MLLTSTTNATGNAVQRYSPPAASSSMSGRNTNVM
jgi:hypothetical protein